MKKKIEFQIKTEHIQALLEGKKITFDYQGLPTIILIPERYGVFMTHEKLMELRKKIGWEAIANTEGFFNELLGEELGRQIFKNN